MSRGLGRIQRLILQVMKERADAEHGRRSLWSVEDIARAVLYQLKPNAVWRGSRAAADLRAAAATRWEVKRAIPRLVTDGCLVSHKPAPRPHTLPFIPKPMWKLPPETEIERAERLESQRRKKSEREGKKERQKREGRNRQQRRRRQERKSEQVEKKKADQQRETLARILGMLGSNSVNERDTAARMAEKMRRELGLSWDDIVTRSLPSGR
jgi:hypothetical protein